MPQNVTLNLVAERTSASLRAFPAAERCSKSSDWFEGEDHSKDRFDEDASDYMGIECALQYTDQVSHIA